ncbi:MAG: SRPBCC family protein [Sphingomonas sp.]
MTDIDVITAHELRFERVLDAPPEAVWRYLADDQLRARWFMGGPSDLRPGGSITFTFDHDRLSDGDVPMPERFRPNVGKRWSEQVTRFEPPHLIAFSWVGGDAGEVTITLDPAGEGRTRLILHHTGLRGPDDARNFGGGWMAHLAALEARIAGRPVANFWQLHAEKEAEAKAAIA